MNDMPAQGFARFQKHILMGALISGILSGIPILNCLNCLFCLINMAGVVLALSMYLKANPDELLTPADSALFGLAAGAGAGLISSIMGMAFTALFSSLIASLMTHLPEASRQMMASSSGGNVMMIPVNMVIFAAFGALGAFLGMQFFFKNRIRKAQQ